LYDSLDDLGKKVLQEAGHDPEGALDLFMFKAKYGRTPNFGGSGSRYGSHKEKPTVLRLFFPRRRSGKSGRKQPWWMNSAGSMPSRGSKLRAEA
jgi:hypothetical protein